VERAAKQWKINSSYDVSIADELQARLNVSYVVSCLLAQRGIHTFEQAREFFRPELSGLHDPFLMKDMEKAVARINDALADNERILVFGDYDVDGTTAVSVMYSFLRSLTANVEFYIPDRYAEGYGISYNGIDYASEKSCKLIIALDCGIKSIDKVAYAKSKGIDFIICDHHLPGDEIPAAVAVLDPKQHDCNYPYKELPGCAIGFKLAHALCISNGVEFEAIENYLDLVAIAIGADIVPITGENRILAWYGLKVLNQMRRPGLRALIENVKIDKEITIGNIVFVIGPRINAAGRIDHGSKAVRLLVTTDADEAKRIAGDVNQNNSDRKDLDTGITSEAIEMLRSDDNTALAKSTVLFNESWHKGVVGIVASRITEHYYKPTIILTESNGKVVGSARSVKDYDVYQAIENCSELLEQFGGHKYAAGLTLKKENLPAFRNKFEEIVSSTITDDLLTAKEEIDLEVNFNDINDKLLRILAQFSPHGPGNMTPVFCSRNVFDTGYGKIVGTNHLKLELYQEGNYFNKFHAIGFGMGDYLPFFQQKRPISICFSLTENNFNNRRSLQIVLRSLKID
jgi:single-stranded-DNA-specific exonuclease